MESLSPLILLLLPYTDIAKAFNDTLFFGVCLISVPLVYEYCSSLPVRIFNQK